MMSAPVISHEASWSTRGPESHYLSLCKPPNMNVAFTTQQYNLKFSTTFQRSVCEKRARTHSRRFLHAPSPLWRCETTPHVTTDKPQSANKTPLQYKVHLLRTVNDISRSDWDSFSRSGCDSPFLRHDWLRCLELSGCASPETGWIPQHVVLKRQDTDEIVAIAPAYVKEHSMGEFVFDQEWADAAYGAGIAYYPKLLLGVPFTPASGRRILTRDEGDRPQTIRVLARSLPQICEALNVSSVHVNFCRPDEVLALSEVGFLERKSVQYHFTNYKKGQKAVGEFEERLKKGECGLSVDCFEQIDAKDRVPYTDFDDYLSEFKSKKRISMRRERRYVREEHRLKIEFVRGKEISEELMENMFCIYKTTIDKLFFGRQYLTLKFFQMLADCEDLKENICLVLAKSEEDGRIVGGTFNVVGEKNGGAFYGRYWGCVEEHRYLHFETCYYAAIEYCIRNGLSRMEPGAGGGDFKYMRGFEPSITMSMHYLRDERLSNAVARYLDMESVHIDGAVLQMKRESAIRSKGAEENSK